MFLFIDFRLMVSVIVGSGLFCFSVMRSVISLFLSKWFLSPLWCLSCYLWLITKGKKIYKMPSKKLTILTNRTITGYIMAFEINLKSPSNPKITSKVVWSEILGRSKMICDNISCRLKVLQWTWVHQASLSSFYLLGSSH